MTPRDILKELRRKPFKPFRITATEGSSYEVRHPEICVVTRDTVYVGLNPLEDEGLLVEDYVLVDIAHVVKIEPIHATAKGKKS